MGARLIIAGGGLAGVLTAIAVAERRPEVEVLVLEAGDRLGGEHTWSFFAPDLRADEAALVDPFVAHRWEGYDVAFRGTRRTLRTPYRSVTSARLHEVALARLPGVRFGASVAAIDAEGVTLGDGTRLEADAVVDARGPRDLAGVRLAFQKFYGREVRLAAPHGLRRPTIMDATVAQHEGYRFVYLLPFGPDTVLIEDTYYAETPEVDAALLRGRIDAYAEGRGWRIAEDLREEQGALPLLLAADFEALWADASGGGAAPAGLRAGLFHPVTGYSLPHAARTALALAAAPMTTAGLVAAVRDLGEAHFARAGFDRLLNRLLFLAGRPENRHRVLERFYRLPEGLVERFYAGRLTSADIARVLVGKPPVPVLAAIRAMPERLGR